MLGSFKHLAVDLFSVLDFARFVQGHGSRHHLVEIVRTALGARAAGVAPAGAAVHRV